MSQHESPYLYRLPPSTFLSRKSDNWYIGASDVESPAKAAVVKAKKSPTEHYDVDRVVNAGVQPPWPGELYMKPVNLHTHAATGLLRRSYMPNQNLDGLGSTDSFGLPLQGLDDNKDNQSKTGLIAFIALAAFAIAFTLKAPKG